MLEALEREVALINMETAPATPYQIVLYKGNEDWCEIVGLFWAAKVCFVPLPCTTAVATIRHTHSRARN